MTELSEELERQGKRLNCYASGDGALHFCWLKGDKACGPSVTVEDVDNFLTNTNDGKRFASEGWTRKVINTLPCIVAPIIRTAVDKVDYKGREYRFVVGERFNDGKIHPGSFKLYTFGVDGSPFLARHEFEVKNWSTIHAIIHYLNHEVEILKQNAE